MPMSDGWVGGWTLGLVENGPCSLMISRNNTYIDHDRTCYW